MSTVLILYRLRLLSNAMRMDMDKGGRDGHVCLCCYWNCNLYRSKLWVDRIVEYVHCMKDNKWEVLLSTAIDCYRSQFEVLWWMLCDCVVV